jgi:hypothetical protein
MEKNPAARYQQPSQLVRDLDAIIAGQPPPTFRAAQEGRGVPGAAAGAPKFPTLKRFRR